MTKAATALFTLCIAAFQTLPLWAQPVQPDAKSPVPAFNEKLEYNGISFVVAAAPSKEGGTVLRVTPKGLKADNAQIEVPLEGKVIRAEIGDINADQSVELYVYVRGGGANDPMRVLAWSANHNKSLNQITFKEIPHDDAKLKGYQGQDDYAVVEGVLMRRFAVAGGKTRQIPYKLQKGEAGWLLVPGHAYEF